MISRILLFVFLPLAAFAETTIEPVAGQSDLAVEWDGASDLSAITWIRDDRFFVVSNRVKGLFPLRLTVDPETGRLSDADFGGKISVTTEESDFEGLIYMPSKDRFFVSTEARSRIVGFDLSGGATFKVEVPPIFRETRQNKSLESLAWDEQRGEMWTSNEDALKCDGDESGREKGALVRLQKFNSKLKPAAQFAYRTEPSLFRISHQGTGVTDMAVSPDGEILVLERVVTVGLCVRIFRVDFNGATDISKTESLKDTKDVVPVKKHLLFEKLTGALNYEGMALGPRLADGSYSVILVADNGGGTTHHFMPLRLRLDAPEKETKSQSGDDKKPKDDAKPNPAKRKAN